ncbi:MAG: S8 family serine peptidase [Vicinamibacteria bacterium]
MRIPVRALTLCMLLASLAAGSAQADDRERLIVRTPKPYDQMVATIRSLGGEVLHKYDNVDALAVSLPSRGMGALLALVGSDGVTKDVVVAAPRPIEEAAVFAAELPGAETLVLDASASAELLASAPANYSFNNALTGAATLHAAGQTGAGVVVAVIDSGTANAPVVPALAGSVIGGENFVAGDPVASATSRLNGSHGTQTGTMIAAHGLFVFNNTSILLQSVLAHAPSSAIPCPVPYVAPCSATRSIIPMVGTAPSASLYALKVFASSGGGAPESRIIAAMDRALTLKRNFDAGGSASPVSGTGTENDPYVYDALDIRVVNMSLGGPTLYAGRDIEDQLTEEMAKAGITLVVSAGNDGPSAMTGGSPGTGLGSLTVGAASTAAHERILRDVQYGLGVGALYRASDHIQTADFSSRGPTADGRIDPDLVANGYASFTQAANGGLSLASGTSFSGPTVAGAAALLRAASPTSTGIQVRNALARTANASLLGDDSGAIDQGEGFVDIPAALALLQSGHVSGRLDDDGCRDGRHRHGRRGAHGRDEPSRDVERNIREAGFRAVSFRNDRFTTSLSDLLPGQAAHFFVEADEKTDQLVVSLDDVTPDLAPADQNAFFGDDLLVSIVDAPTSFADQQEYAFVAAPTSFTLDDPQTGLVRVTVLGDWTNAGAISANLTIDRVRASQGFASGRGRVAEGDLVPFEFEVAAGTGQAVVELSWKEHWGRYPTNDLDLVLIDPSGAAVTDGATLASPERVVLASPAPGTWTALVQGFTVHDVDEHGRKHGHQGGTCDRPAQDEFELRVSLDGTRLRLDP